VLKAVKLYFDSRNMSGKKILNLIFGERKETLKAAELLILRMKNNGHLAITRREVRALAKEIDSGKHGFRYSYHNFYTKMLRKLISLGFIEREVLIWDEFRKKTESVYQLKLQQIPERPPQGGFIKHAWYIAKAWNDYVKS
jgi:hypothetical protein